MPTLKTCKTCEQELPSTKFNGGSADNCDLCMIKAEDARNKAALEKRRLEKLEAAAAKAERSKKKAQRKVQVAQRKKAEKEKAKAEAKKKADAKRFVSAQRKKVNRAKREIATRQLAQRHLLPFIIRHKPDYIPGWVHKDICARLEQFEEDVRNKKSPRLMIQMPPRHGKSEIASVNFPAWYLGKNPTHEIITSSYASSLAEEFSKKVRSLVRSDEYKVVFNKTRMDPDNQNASGWRTTRGGGFVPAGVGGGITGKGAHVLIIDDPIKNAEEAESEMTQEKIWDWYTSTAYTRLAPGGGVLIIQTRWSDVDLSGRLEHDMENGDGDTWEIVRYPAIAVENETYRREGEALHPARYDLESLHRIRQAVGGNSSWTWNALYQQNPVAEEGGYFTRESIQWYAGDAPKRLHIYSTWDLAIGKGDRNDYTVGLVVGVDEEDNIWVLDMRRGRWDSFEIVDQIIDVYHEWHPEVTGIEKGQIQMAIGPFLEQRIEEERIYDINIQDLSTGRKDKELRARAIQGRIKQGKVRFPNDKRWMDDLLGEMVRFPHGNHDDCVDALAHVGLMLQEMDAPAKQIFTQHKDKNGWKAKLERKLAMARRGRSPMAS